MQPGAGLRRVRGWGRVGLDALPRLAPPPGNGGGGVTLPTLAPLPSGAPWTIQQGGDSYGADVTASPEKNKRSGSTTYEWRKVKVRGGAPEGPSAQPSTKGFHGLSRRNGSTALTLTIVHRGGAESWWLVKARGRHRAFPGHWALDDVMAVVNQEFGQRPENRRDR